MKSVVFFTNIDWANVSTIHSKMINDYSEKYKSSIICYKPHTFKYTLKHDYDVSIDPKNIKKKQKIISILENADIIIEGYEGADFIGKIKKFIPNFHDIINDKKKIIYHASYQINNVTENNDYLLQLFVPEIYHHGIKNKSKVVIPSCPLESLPNILDVINTRKNNPKIVISHFPSRNGQNGRCRKGSDIINAQIKRITDKYSHVEYKNTPFANRPHSEIIKSKLNTDIYIDQYNNEIGGFGVSSLESLTSGCIVLCSINKLPEKEFRKMVNFDNFPIYDISGEADNIYKVLDNLCQLSKDELAQIALKNIDWINNNLSGKKYLNYFEQNILDEI